MLETSARLLRLLSLLQARADWSGPELAERLGVTTRSGSASGSGERTCRKWIGWPSTAVVNCGSRFSLDSWARQS